MTLGEKKKKGKFPANREKTTGGLWKSGGKKRGIHLEVRNTAGNEEFAHLELRNLPGIEEFAHLEMKNLLTCKLTSNHARCGMCGWPLSWGMNLGIFG